MRIVIAKKLLSTVGGSEVVARRLAHALAERGHDVTCVGLRPAWPRPGIPRHAVGPGGPAVSQERGVRYVFLPARLGRAGAALDGLLPTSFADPRLLAGLVSGADVVHSVAREWAGALERVARRAGAAFVETPLAHPGQPFSGGARGDVSRYRRDDAVIALTDWEASFYRQAGARNVHVTGLGVALNGVSAPLPDAPTVLFVGRKERYKGYDALRDAARLVWRERPEARFVAIGQSAWSARFRRRESDPRWTELGVVDEATKAAAYAGATVLAMPSDHETFGHAYLEAWAAGRPVIAGDIPPLREIVRDGVDGWCVRNDAREIARAVLTVFADPARAAAMGEAGRDRVRERWTWPLVAARTEAAYASAIAARTASR